MTVKNDIAGLPEASQYHYFARINYWRGDKKNALFGTPEPLVGPALIQLVEVFVMITTKTIHVIDDDAALCESVAGFLALHGYSVRQHPSADAFLAGYEAIAETGPAIVVSDVRMPGRSGLALLQDMRVRAAEDGRILPVILVSGHANVPLAVHAMREGALHFLEKPVDPDQLLATVQAAFETLEQQDRHDERAQDRLKDLTPREREVLAAFVTRGSNKAVASALSMSPRTVEVHRTRIFRKSGASTVPELVRIALEAGVTEARHNPRHP